MSSRFAPLWWCLTLCLLPLLSCTQPAGPDAPAATAGTAGDTVDTVVTLPEAFGAWRAERPPETFVGDELFMYINGGAEIYYEYGFDRVMVADYQSQDEQLTVEVYTMTDQAYGIYTYSRSARGQTVDLGNGGTLAEYYLTFWSGPNLVVITAQAATEHSQEQVLALAQELAARFPASGEVPALMAQLPPQPIPGSEHYLRGRIAMRNLSPLVPPLFSGYEEAAAARYGGAESSLYIILAWPDQAGAAAAMAAAREALPPGDSTSDGFRSTANTQLLQAEQAGAQILITIAGETGDPQGGGSA